MSMYLERLETITLNGFDVNNDLIEKFRRNINL